MEMAGFSGVTRMTPYQQEQIEIIRRTAERGRRLAQPGAPVLHGEIVDLFQHILDELLRLQKSADNP